MPTTNDRVALGRIGKAYGLQGAFRVWPYADDVERFRDLQSVFLTREAKSVRAAIQSVQIRNGFVVIQTDQVTRPEDVIAWLGGDVEIEAAERVTLPAGQYFHDQIIGLRVETVEGVEVGTVVQIMDAPGNDVYVCRGDRGEFLIPAIDVFVKKIDPSTGVIVIAPIPGMID